MINTHAILLIEDNFETIIRETNAHRESLYAILEDSQHEGMNYYIVAHRRTENGLLHWEAMTLVELCVEYRLANVDRFKHRFSRV